MTLLITPLSSSAARRFIVKGISSSTSLCTGRRLFGSTNVLRTVTPIKLHTEWIAPEGSEGDQDNGTNTKDENSNYTILFMHGLLGNGKNLKTFARKLVKQLSSNHGSCGGGILMDLRGHGSSFQSQRKEENTVENDASTFKDCAEDIHHTLKGFHSRISASPTEVLVGHSFGGRLALEYAATTVDSATPITDNRNPLRAIWLLDTVPGEANESVDKVLSIITNVLEDRGKNNTTQKLGKKDMVKILTDPPHNMDLPTAQWLAMSYDEKSEDNFGFDNNLVTRLKAEFANQDFMGLLRQILQSNKSHTESPTIVHVVRGGKNKGWSIPILSELESMKKEYPSTFHLHVLPSAGHNVHIDDLAGLLKLFAGTYQL